MKVPSVILSGAAFAESGTSVSNVMAKATIVFIERLQRSPSLTLERWSAR